MLNQPVPVLLSHCRSGLKEWLYGRHKRPWCDPEIPYRMCGVPFSPVVRRGKDCSKACPEVSQGIARVKRRQEKRLLAPPGEANDILLETTDERRGRLPIQTAGFSGRFLLPVVITGINP